VQALRGFESHPIRQALSPDSISAVGKRSGYPDTNAAVEALTLAELNREIQRSLIGYQLDGRGPAGKAFFKRLVWLETQRQRLHGIDAKRRRFGEP
jgi:hypothetical protein